MRIFSTPANLDEHILGSYAVLRFYMIAFGFALPLILVIGGSRSWFLKEALPVQTSLSSYYHAGSACIHSQGAYRDLFVGLLTAIAFSLIIYRGFGSLENWLLNLAGLGLLGVAYFPTDWPKSPDAIKGCHLLSHFNAIHVPGTPISLHIFSAVMFFLAITLVNTLTSHDTISLIDNPRQKQFWDKVFKWVRWIMPAALITTLFFFYRDSRLVLWIEWAGIWAFSVYWLIKSIEIFTTKLEAEIPRVQFAWSGKNRGRRLVRTSKRASL